MKRRIIYPSTQIMAGRDPNTAYADLQIRQWSFKQKDLLNQLAQRRVAGTNPKKVAEVLKQRVRECISQGEDLRDKLDQYIQILDTFNSSSCSAADMNVLETQLRAFKW